MTRGSFVAAGLLLGLVACGSPANSGALLFAAATASGAAAGGGASAAGGAGESSGGGAASNSGTAGTGVGGTGGAGGTSSAGGTAGGVPNGGGGGGTAGSPAGGAPSVGTGGSTPGDCSAFGVGASYYSGTGHCYLVVSDLTTFAMAKIHCTSLGAHLVTLSNQLENDFVWSLDPNEHWIGATDDQNQKDPTPGPYSWVDGEPFAYTDWSPGQPNASATTCAANSGGGTCYEHCGFQWSGGSMPGEWNDRLCTHTIEAVCEWGG